MIPRPGPTRWALLALLACGCDAPSLDVRFEIPERYRAEVTSVRLQVLEPPVAAPFDCDAVALGLVDEDALRLSQTLQVAIQPDADPQPLVGIRREGRKLLVGEGFDASSRRLTAACAEVGDIEGATEVVLPGEPAALLEIVEAPLDSPWAPESLDVVVSDGRSAALEGARVRWSVVGPAREERSGETVAAADGRSTVPVECTSRSGPSLLDVRVRWQNEAVSPLRFFQAFKGIWSWPLPAPANADDGGALLLSGRIGPAGQLGFLVGTYDQACDCAHLSAWYTGMPPGALLSVALPTAPAVTAAGIFSRGDVDVLVARSAEAWLELSVGDSSLAWIPAGAAPPPLTDAQAIVDLAPCQGGSRVLVAHAGGELSSFDAAGGYVEVPLDASALADARLPVASACVDSSDGVARRVVAFAKRCPSSGPCDAAVLDDEVTLAVHEGDALLRLAGSFPSLDGRGVGFTPPVGGAERLLLALDVPGDPSSFVGEGLGLGRYRLAVAGGEPALERVRRDDTTLLAASPVGGDFDGDGLLDVSALLLGGDDGGGGVYELAYFTVLGVEHPLGPLLAALDVGEPSATPPMVAGDFDGDGYDDVLFLQPGDNGDGAQVLLARFGEHGGACRGAP